MRSNVFFALWPDDVTRAAIAASARALREAMSPRGRWIGAHRYHLTLAFLGAFEADAMGATIERANAAAARVDATRLEFSLDVAGSFQNRSISWWLGCAIVDARLVALWQSLDASLGRADLRTDADHVAHLTVLRDAERLLPSTPLAAFGAAPIRWRADDFVLVDSRFGADSRYDVVGRWPLRA